MAVLLRPLLSGLIVTLVAMVAYLSLQNASLREAAARHAKEDAEQVAKLAEAVAELHLTVLDATNTLNTQAATIKESTNAQVRSLTAQRDDLRRRLRESQANLAKSALPAATQLPPLATLPAEVKQPSFIPRLDTMLFPKPTEQTSSGLTTNPAKSSMGLRVPCSMN